MKKIALSIGVILIAVVAMMTYQGLFPPEVVAVLHQTPSSSLVGKIVSVENIPSNPPKPGLRRAVVKLDAGETVQAWVPAACVVFPGDVMHLAKFGDSYLVVGENGPDNS